tara:strand:+ start:1062 stop:1691 length:630 start_codon:yes stop_codon:yes gene_type:complete
MSNYWIIRQNPCKKTDQDSIKDAIIQNSIITGPYSHHKVYSHNTENNFTNNIAQINKNNHLDDKGSKNQDKTFINKMKIGDVVCILFSKTTGLGIQGLKTGNVIFCQIVSGPKYHNYKGFLKTIYNSSNGDIVKFTNNIKKYKDNKKYRIDGDDFNPVYRDVKILSKTPLTLSELKYDNGKKVAFAPVSLQNIKNKQIINFFKKHTSNK